MRHTIEGRNFPCRYIKIMPIQSWGPSFNFSIWHVELRGLDGYDTVQEAAQWLQMYKERESIRICLKHLRQHNYSEAFESLQKKTRVHLEDPLLTELHRILVIEGDFDRCEALIERAVREGMFSEYVRSQAYTPLWRPVFPANSKERPGMRGGHQMCIDCKYKILLILLETLIRPPFNG